MKDATRPLTSAVSSHVKASSQYRSCKGFSKWSRCTTYKGVLTILLCNMLVGITYGILAYSLIGLALKGGARNAPFHNALNLVLLAYGIQGLVQMLYPIGGLLADVRCGRYTIIKSSLVSIWIGFIITCFIGLSFRISKGVPSPALNISQGVGVLVLFVAFLVGFSGFQSNAVHFGLDQLLDASSEELSLFLHWFVWTECAGELISRLLSSASVCSDVGEHVSGYMTLPILALSTVCLILVFRRRHWFNCESVVGNPYQNVYRVLKFAAKHSKPLGHRSALTYSDDVKPPRIDFAKQKYGGIFTTEVVEDVKTFLRILLMLLVITPVFYLEVATSYFFPIYGLHLGKNVSVISGCTYEWMIFESDNLSCIISVVAVPLYVILIYPRIKKWVPRIIYRMGIGISLKVALGIIMFIFQVVANYSASHFHNTLCVFLSQYKGTFLSQTLEFPTQTLAVLNLLNGVASPLINITVLEFISAQSPHTMKGLLLGVFYAFRGLFITMGSVVTITFTQEKLWGDHHGIFDCGFYYYLSNSVFGVIGLVVFLMAAKWYRNRERDDPPYKHQYAEDYYSRYASRPTTRLVEEEVESYGSINN